MANSFFHETSCCEEIEDQEESQDFSADNVDYTYIESLREWLEESNQRIAELRKCGKELEGLLEGLDQEEVLTNGKQKDIESVSLLREVNDSIIESETLRNQRQNELNRLLSLQSQQSVRFSQSAGA